MKKYIFGMLMAVGLLASCSNDDIDITVVEKNQTTFSYSVETQNVYDKFNATNTLKSVFLSGDAGDYYLAVYTYIYDDNGQLVANGTDYEKTFGEVSRDFTLADGKYTAVSVEMIVDKDNKYESETFEMVGTEKLSTLEISFKKDADGDYLNFSTLWYECIGVSTQQLNVNGELHTLKVTPKPIGVVLNTEFTNFDKSTYNILSVNTKNVPVGRYLDPQKTGDARFHYLEYNPSGTISARWIGVYLDGIPSREGADVYFIEEGDIECSLSSTFYNGVEIERFPTPLLVNGMRDGETYYGGMYYIGGEYQSGKDYHVGVFKTQAEYNSWFKEAQAADNTRLSLVTPYMIWGAKVSAVHSAMVGAQQTKGTSTTGIYNSSTGTYYTEYQGMDMASKIQYNFTTSTNGLFEASVAYDSKRFSVSKIKDELDAKYIYLTVSDNGSYGYATNDYKTIILLVPGSTYNIVAYMDVSYVSSSKRALYDQVMKAKCSEPSEAPLSLTKQKYELAKPFLINKSNRFASEIK